MRQGVEAKKVPGQNASIAINNEHWIGFLKRNYLTFLATDPTWPHPIHQRWKMFWPDPTRPDPTCGWIWRVSNSGLESGICSSANATIKYRSI